MEKHELLRVVELVIDYLDVMARSAMIIEDDPERAIEFERASLHIGNLWKTIRKDQTHHDDHDAKRIIEGNIRETEEQIRTFKRHQKQEDEDIKTFY